MATLVCFHAHPDDEPVTTGGTMARAAAEGHRVVLVVATDGSLGEIPDDLAGGETLVDRRRAETIRSAALLGVARIVWLGYRDSGMTGWPQNDDPESLHRAPLDEAAKRLAAVLREEDAAVLTVYDWHGNYGHPDHIAVHRVGHRAAELAGTSKVFDATTNRHQIKEMMALMAEPTADGAARAAGPDFDPDAPADDGNPFGMQASELTLAVDVSGYVGLKRQAVACHASQATDVGMFLAMPAEVFAMAFSTEWFVERGVTPAPDGPSTGWLF